MRLYLCVAVSLLIIVMALLSSTGHTKEIVYNVPEGCTALSGYWNLDAGEVKNISIIDTTKTLEVNPDDRSFIIYGVDRDPIFGHVIFELDNPDRYLFTVDVTAADAEAKEILQNDLMVKEWTYGAVHKTRIER